MMPMSLGCPCADGCKAIADGLSECNVRLSAAHELGTRMWYSRRIMIAGSCKRRI